MIGPLAAQPKKRKAPARPVRRAKLSPDAQKRATTKRLRTTARRRETIALIVKRSHVSKTEAARRYEAGLRISRSDAIFSPSDEARNRLAAKYTFRRRKDGSLDTRSARLVRKDGKPGKRVSAEKVRRSRAAFLREARYRQIAEIEGTDVKGAKRLVKERYGGRVREALVKVTYSRIAGAHEKRKPNHWTDYDEGEEDGADE